MATRNIVPLAILFAGMYLMAVSAATTASSFRYNVTTMDSTLPTPAGVTEDHTGIPVVELNDTRRIEKCDQRICEKNICRVDGPVSRPSFYARCGLREENGDDLTFYCMCATAYHTAASKDTEPAYVPITPDINCQIPETPEDQGLCEQTRCQGPTKKLSKTVHICEAQGKLYCACFN